jgi:uronate dehydrogenase
MRASGATRRIVVTGAAGRIGTVVVPSLRGSHDVRAFDRRGGRGIRRADLRRPRAARRAFAGADVIIDLAADSHVDATWTSVHGNSIPLAWTTLSTAAALGVRRVVVASSLHAVGRHELEEPSVSVLSGRYDGLDPEQLPRLPPDAPACPVVPYGVGKAFVETAARFFAETRDISVICLRIGTVTSEGRPTSVRHFSTLLSHGDLAQLVECCIGAPNDVRWGMVYGLSRNTWRLWDVDAAEPLIGYRPRDDAESWR